MKKSSVLISLLIVLFLMSCGGSPADAVKSEVETFMESVINNNLDAAVKMVQNKMDLAVPDKIENYFRDKTITSYTLIADDDPKAKIAMDRGIATMDAKIEYSGQESTIRFIMGKSDDGKWVISNIMLDLP